MSKTKKILHFIFPFLSWIGLLKDKNILRADIIAWITVALIVIPQAMAYASLAWFDTQYLQYWLYTALIGVIIWWLFGSSRQMSTWAVTIVALMTATALEPLATTPETYAVYASLLALFIWVFYLLLWFLRLWIIVEFLSNPVIIWFTNAVALITVIKQLPKIFWVDVPKNDNILIYIIDIFKYWIDNVFSITFLFWAGAIVFMILLQKFFPKYPKVLIILFLSIIASYLIGYSGDYGWKIVWIIPQWLPEFVIPYPENISFEQIKNLAIFSIIIALIWFTETIAVAKFVATTTKQRLSPNKELIWQWLANVSSSFFGGFWVAWSFSKTAVNLKSWAKTPFASVLTWILVWITLMFLTPLLYYLPIAILSAIIIVAVSHLIKIEPLIKYYKIEKKDWILWVLTFFLTLWFYPSIENWIILWVLISLSLFIHKSMRPKLQEMSLYKDWDYKDAEELWLKTSKEISILRFNNILYFANSSYFEKQILDILLEKDKLKIMVLELEWMWDIDSSGVESFESIIETIKKTDVELYITGLRVKVINKLWKVNFFKKFWKENIFPNIESLVEHLFTTFNKKEVNLRPLLKYSPKKNLETKDDLKILKKLVDKYVKK